MLPKQKLFNWSNKLNKMNSNSNLKIKWNKKMSIKIYLALMNNNPTNLLFVNSQNI